MTLLAVQSHGLSITKLTPTSNDTTTPDHPTTEAIPEVVRTVWSRETDAELEACCEWLQDPDLNVDTYKLRVARRPKPPSLKEQALLAIDTAVADYRIAADVADVVRRALEQLPDNN